MGAKPRRSAKQSILMLIRGFDVGKALGYSWKNTQSGFNDAIGPGQPGQIGLLLEDDIAQLGDTGGFYWFESLEELVAWVCRCAAVELGDDGSEDPVFDIEDDEELERLEKAFGPSGWKRAAKLAETRIRRIGETARTCKDVAAFREELDTCLGFVTSCGWIGRLEGIARAPEDRERDTSVEETYQEFLSVF